MNAIILIIVTVVKKPWSYSASTEEIETNLKSPEFKVSDRVRITKHNIFSKKYTNNWSRETFIIDFVIKSNPWACRKKDFNREKIIQSFCCWVIFKGVTRTR